MGFRPDRLELLATHLLSFAFMKEEKARIQHLGARPEGLSEAVFVHPFALVESSQIGAGTRVWAFSHVLSGAVVGRDCNVCEGAFIEGGACVGSGVTIKNGISIWDGVTIEDDVFLGPRMIFTNHPAPRAFVKEGKARFKPTLVKRGCTIGAGAIILCGVTLGEYSMIGAGAVVTRDVPAGAQVQGSPARISGWVCKCLKTKKPSGFRGVIECEWCADLKEVGLL